MKRIPTIFDHMQNMQEEMDRMFRNFPLLTTERNYQKPLADMWEEDKQIIIECEIPGIPKDAIEINYKDNMLNIRAERTQEDNNRQGYFERSYTGFYRSINLPQNTLIDQTKASFKDGILRIEIPKKEEIDDKGKTIAIE